jgi:hypothetical protein
MSKLHARLKAQQKRDAAPFYRIGTGAPSLGETVSLDIASQYINETAHGKEAAEARRQGRTETQVGAYFFLYGITQYEADLMIGALVPVQSPDSLRRVTRASVQAVARRERRRTVAGYVADLWKHASVKERDASPEIWALLTERVQGRDLFTEREQTQMRGTRPDEWPVYLATGKDAPTN